MSDHVPELRRPPEPMRPEPLKRTPFRVWLVTGPVGRLVGFTLDFARALRAHRRATKNP